MATRADSIAAPEHLPDQATNAFDRILQSIWPSSQLDLAYSVYARLIERLYEDIKTLLIGYVTISIPTLIIAWLESSQILALEYFLVFLPIIVLRLFTSSRYISQPQTVKFLYARRDEARYFASSASIVFAIALIILTVTATASVYARLSMSIVAICYMTGIMARNAMSPRLVQFLSLVVALPTALGLLLLGDLLSLSIAVMMLGLTVHMARIAYAGKQETVAALIQADAAERLANFDVLTGLPNRHYMLDDLKRRLAAPHARKSLSVLMLDIDKFKAINDSRGHPLGDELLKQAAVRISQAAKALNPRALTARLGGDEFIVLTDHRGRATAEAIIARMEAPFELSAGTIMTSCSIGVMTPTAGSDEVALLKGVDLALYAAKQAGRRRWMHYDPTMEDTANRALLLETRFREALTRKELAPAFQPIVRFSDGETVGYESLARWTDAVLGPVSPGEFVPFAEESGLCDALTGVLLPASCRSIGALSNTASVTFNVSVAEFDRPAKLLQSIRDALAESELPPGRLWIEITEGLLICDFDSVLQTLQAIRALGVKIALDDFGSGFSSLSYLAKLGDVIDAIKLDKAIVNKAMSDRTQEIIIRMVTEVAAEINAIVIAECIEDEETASTMKRLGVTHAQGYLYGKPDSILNLIAQKAQARTPRQPIQKAG